MGRPPLEGTGRVRMTPRAGLTARQAEALAALCKRWGCDESEAIRRALVSCELQSRLDGSD